MTIEDSVLQNNEKILFALRQLYQSAGYRPYRMSKFEEYDLYAENKDFLVSDNVITFTDTSGKLMALKPDVTLSIIKNSQDAPDETQKVYYNESVYRVSKSTGSFMEIMQTGVECFGSVGIGQIAEVIRLAVQSLRLLSSNAVLAVSDLSVLTRLVKMLTDDAERRREILKAIGEKNSHELTALLEDCEGSSAAQTLLALMGIHGNLAEVRAQLQAVLGDLDCDLLRLIDALEGSEELSGISFDFSVTGDIHYYNSIVFQGFLPGAATAVLSGGQYDKLMRRLKRASSAVGFAVYTDALDRVELSKQQDGDEYINIALPKGRLGTKVYEMFAKAGYECPSILEPNRKLIFENENKRVRYFWVKPSDVTIYVERGVADVGVCGKDILLEYEPEVNELLDLKKGKCRMAVAAPNGFMDDCTKTLRVATKFSNIAKKYYQSKGRAIDIVHLNGSIEIAPILGLTDVIVDIVETGTTLKENDLSVVETILPISARLIANKAACEFKFRKIKTLSDAIAQVVKEEV